MRLKYPKFLFQLSLTLYGNRKCLLWSQSDSTFVQVFCASHRAVSYASCVKGAVPFQGENTEDFLALLMFSEWGNGANHILDLVGFSMLVLASPILCGVWCQGQLLPGTLTVSEITHHTVPGDTPLARGVDLEVPVHSWTLGWMDSVLLPKTCAWTFLWAWSLQETQWDLLYCKHLQGVKNKSPCTFLSVFPGAGEALCVCGTVRNRQCSLPRCTAEG